MYRVCFTALAIVALTLTSGSALAGEGKWIEMFDGKTLKGWKANEAKNSFYVEDGAIVSHGQPRSHLFYVGDGKPFKNFELTADIKTNHNSNAGLYFHTKYQEKGWPKYGFECQINNTYKDPKKTASIYGVKNLLEPPAKDNEWFTMTIKVQGKTVTVGINGKTVNEYTEPEGTKPGKNFTRVFDEGTFAIQAHDKGSIVRLKNLKVRRLP